MCSYFLFYSEMTSFFFNHIKISDGCSGKVSYVSTKCRLAVQRRIYSPFLNRTSILNILSVNKQWPQTEIRRRIKRKSQIMKKKNEKQQHTKHITRRTSLHSFDWKADDVIHTIHLSPCLAIECARSLVWKNITVSVYIVTWINFAYKRRTHFL